MTRLPCPSPQPLARPHFCRMAPSLALTVQRGSLHTNVLREGATPPASVTPSTSPPGLRTSQREPAVPVFPKSVSIRTGSDITPKPGLKPKHHGCVSGNPASPGHCGSLCVTCTRGKRGPTLSPRAASQPLANGAALRLSPAAAGNVWPSCAPRRQCYSSRIRRGFVIAGGILSCHSKLVIKKNECGYISPNPDLLRENAYLHLSKLPVIVARNAIIGDS